MVRQIGEQLQLKTFRWTVTEGMQAFDPSYQPRIGRQITGSIKLHQKLARTAVRPAGFFHPYLNDSVHLRF